MKIRRAFKAKVLGLIAGEYARETITFGEDDSEVELDLTDPFVCLNFVESQVRQRTYLKGVEDFEVVMNAFGSDEGGLVSDNYTVRPWRYPQSEERYKTAKR